MFLDVANMSIASGQFGTRELIKYLTDLGFSPARQVGSSHNRWLPPEGTESPLAKFPFITVIQGKKTYAPQTCRSYIKQIAKFELP